MISQTQQAYVNTCLHFIEMWEGKPDRKGALQEVKRELQTFELEYETTPILEPMPKSSQVLFACGFVVFLVMVIVALNQPEWVGQ